MSEAPLSSQVSSVLDQLDQLEEIVLDGTRVPFSGGRLVNEQDAIELMDAVREALPGQLSQAEALVRQKEEVISTARQQADEILQQARQQREQLINAQAVRQEAERQVAELRDQARQQCEQMIGQARQQVAKVEQDQQARLAQMEQQFSQRRQQLEQEALQRRQQLDQEAIELKRQLGEQHEQARQQSLMELEKIRQEAMRLQQELDLVLVLGPQVHRAVDALKGVKNPVVLEETIEFLETDPETKKETKIRLAKLLADAGIPFALSLGAAAPSNYAWWQLASCVRQGVDKKTAMAAMTEVPAKLLGLDDQIGTLEVGKLANLQVLTGDPMQATSWVETVVLEGQVVYERSKDPKLQYLFEAETNKASKAAGPDAKGEPQKDEAKKDGAEAGKGEAPKGDAPKPEGGKQDAPKSGGEVR